MATDDNKQIVKGLFAAFGSADIAVLRDLVAEDVIWHLPGKVPHYRTTEAPCREIGILRSLVLNSNWIP
jgi:ketosteroid isomerase-like protein